MILVCEFKTGLNYITVVHVDNSYIADVSGILTWNVHHSIYIYILITFKTKTKNFTEICVDLNLLMFTVFTLVFIIYLFIYYLNLSLFSLIWISTSLIFSLNTHESIHYFSRLLCIKMSLHVNIKFCVEYDIFKYDVTCSM